MKNSLLLISLCFILSCFKKSTQVEPNKAVIYKSSQSEKVGADKDAHGCIGSAGYIWSELKNHCVRIFEVGTRLNSNQKNDTTSAFIIFDKRGEKVELFTTLEEKSIILTRKSEGESWVYNDWEFIPWKGFVLKKRGTILFTGQ